MSTFTRTTATDWVCTDCHLSIAGYSADELGHEHPAPFAGIEGIEDVTNGTPISECDTPECVAAVAALLSAPSDPERFEPFDRAQDLHTECDHDSFSLHPCAGCGSSLAGDRYAVTVSYIEWAEPFTTDTDMARRMALGHRMRKGHELTGYYTPPVGGVTTLVRTCCE